MIMDNRNQDYDLFDPKMDTDFRKKGLLENYTQREFSLVSGKICIYFW